MYTYDSTESKPSPILDNLLQCIHSDEFDLQQEAVHALEQACLDPALLQLLASPAHLTSIVAPLARELERLLRVPSSDVPLSVARIVSAITDAHTEQCTVSGNTRCVFHSTAITSSPCINEFLSLAAASTIWCMRGWMLASRKLSTTSRWVCNYA